jgi:hypothetical protein
MQTLQNNHYYLLQMHLIAAAAAAAANPAPPSRRAPQRIEYSPLAREAEARQADTTSMSFKFTKGPYTAYGSTDDGWRDVAPGRRFVLPSGCTPRRSKRFM